MYCPLVLDAVDGARELTMYAFRHAVGALLSPVTLALLSAAFAVVFRLCRRSRASNGLAQAAVLLAYLGSTSLVGDLMLHPLESRFAPLREDQLPPGVGYVVALGSDYQPHVGLPITAALDREGLVRIVEALRILRHNPGAKLIASGGAPAGQQAPALGYSELAREFGLESQSVIVLAGGLDTAAEARTIAATVGETPVILVTSAYHMPRAVCELQRAGVRVVPAPTGQLTYGLRLSDWHVWLPSASGLEKSERAMHEYVGLAMLRMRPQ